MTADERLDVLAKGLRDLADRLAAPVPPPDPDPEPDPEPEPEPEPEPPVPDPDTTTVTGRHEFEELHVHEGKTLAVLPGAVLIRLDVPAADPAHADGGLVVHGHLRADDAFFRSANPSGTRGHLMVHGTAELVRCAVADMGRTRIEPFGETNKIARYALHFHEVAHDRPSRVEGCEVYHTAPGFRHGVVVHGPNRGLAVRGNHVHHTGGTGVYCEDGTEEALVEGNVVEDVLGTGGDHTANPARPDQRDLWSGDLGYNGSGIYCRGPLNRVRNNTVRRCPIGYLYYQFQGPTRLEPVREFAGNVAEDCYNGAEFWSLGGNAWEQWDQPRPVRSVLAGFTARRCVVGVFSYEQTDVTYTGFLLEDCQTGVKQNDYYQARFELRDSTFVRCGFDPSTVTVGGLLVEGCTFDGPGAGVTLATLWFNGDPRQIPPRRVVLRNCRFVNGAAVYVGETGSGNRSYLTEDELVVEAADGAYRVYRDTQDAGAVLPQTAYHPGNPDFPALLGCPEAGLTNAEALARHGVCRAGAVTPADAVRVPWVVGGRVARVG